MNRWDKVTDTLLVASLRICGYFGGMRRARLKAPESWAKAYYHCVSRVVDRRKVFGPEEKREFVRFMRFYARVSCVRVVAYCVMSNHFHVLVEVPARPAVLPTEAELLKHIRGCYGRNAAEMVGEELRQYRSRELEAMAQKVMDGWFARMWDVSAFMKTLKQRFTQWFNKRHQRSGTLWEDRYHSTIVQGENVALAIVAAYIDLNPVRAGLVQDPKDYPWSGYAAALAGVKVAREGVETVLSYLYMNGSASIDGTTGALRTPGASVRQPLNLAALEAYRMMLYEAADVGDEIAEAAQQAAGMRHGLGQAAVEAVRAAGGKLSRMAMLRCRVRYFTAGAVLGTRRFVNEVFLARRECFGLRRREGAHAMRGADFGGLYALRDLKRAAITGPQVGSS